MKIKRIFNIFSKENKLKKEEKKQLVILKKLRDEYTILDNKLESGDINKKEYDRYIELKEEIKKMVKKFVLKDGKLALNTDDGQESKEQVQKEQVPKEPKVQEQVHKEPKNQEQVPKEPKVQEQVREQINEEELRKHIIAQQERLHQQAAQQHAAQQYYAQQQAAQQHAAQHHTAQQHAAQQQAAQQESDNRKFVVTLYVQDLPEMALPIYGKHIPVFMDKLQTAITENTFFEFNDYYIVANKVIMVSFIDEQQLLNEAARNKR
jgi:hypothetical protein